MRKVILGLGLLASVVFAESKFVELEKDSLKLKLNSTNVACKSHKLHYDGLRKNVVKNGKQPFYCEAVYLKNEVLDKSFVVGLKVYRDETLKEGLFWIGNQIKSDKDFKAASKQLEKEEKYLSLKFAREIKDS